MFYFSELADSIGEFQSCTDVIGTLFPHYSDFLTVHFFPVDFCGDFISQFFVEFSTSFLCT